MIKLNLSEGRGRKSRIQMESRTTGIDRRQGHDGCSAFCCLADREWIVEETWGELVGLPVFPLLPDFSIRDY